MLRITRIAQEASNAHEPWVVWEKETSLLELCLQEGNSPCTDAVSVPEEQGFYLPLHQQPQHKQYQNVMKRMKTAAAHAGSFSSWQQGT